MKHEFTDEQIKYIIDNWGKESPHSMKNRFGCSWLAVSNVAKAHGLEPTTPDRWTKEEEDLLRILSDKYHYKKIAKKMNKSENAIYLKARKMGITLIQNGRKWTKEEEVILKDLWGSKSIELIAKKLKRTVFALKVKAVRMNLGPMIENNYDVITVPDICELLGVTKDRVYGTWVKLGLNLNNIKLTKSDTCYAVTWEDLMKFLEANQNEWDSRNVEVNMLGLEPDWLKEKRKRDMLENPLWYRRWTKKEQDEAIRLYKMGKTTKEIGDIINRSEDAVLMFLRNNGYKNPMYWTDEEVKYLKSNYIDMQYSEIAKKLGRTTKAVTYKAESLGLVKRKRKK